MLIPPKDRNQLILYTSLDTMVDKDSDVRFLDQLIDKIISDSPEKFKYKGEKSSGRPAYSVPTMLKLYVYGYLEKIDTCRGLEKETHRNIELKWLLGDLQPDFKTIADFRKDNAELIKEFSKQLKGYLKSQKLIGGVKIAADGTKLKASASREMLKRKDIIEELKQIDRKINTYLKDLHTNDLEEDNSVKGVKARHELVKNQLSEKNEEIGDLLKKKENLETILEVIKAQKNKNHYSETDPDCNLMKSKTGFKPGYNGQIAVDSLHHFIVHESVTNQRNDINQLSPIVESLQKDLALKPEEILADTGYCNLEEIAKLIDKGIDCYVPKQPGADKSGIKFTYDEEKDVYICQEGRHLVKRHSNKKYQNSIIDVYVGDDCKSCKHFISQLCTRSKTGRNKSRYHNQKWRDEYIEEMKTEEARSKIRKRKAIVEHVFGSFKIWMGKLQLKTRGLRNVNTEFSLWSSVYNIKKLIKMMKEGIIPLKGLKNVILCQILKIIRTTYYSAYHNKNIPGRLIIEY